MGSAVEPYFDSAGSDCCFGTTGPSLGTSRRSQTGAAIRALLGLVPRRRALLVKKVRRAMSPLI